MTLTPAMQQYYDMKKEYSDSILFFRMWDFYEMFDEDAHIAHRVLWINVTSRNKNADKPQPLAWIPYHAKDKYLPMLINAWYKVAICEQVSDPKLKWIVKREVVRVVTPSTLYLEWEQFDNIEWNNCIVSIVEDKWAYALSMIDLKNNTWSVWEFSCFSFLELELFKISPKEVILDKKLYLNTELKDILWKKYSLNIFYFEAKYNSREKLLKHFNTRNLEWFWIEEKKLSQKAASMLLEYIEWNQKNNFNFLDSISYMTFNKYMDLSESTIRSLDLIYNFSTNSRTIWTLFWVLNKTNTAMWNRLLRNNILSPLQDIKEINERQIFIWEFLDNTILLDKVRDKLKIVSDIDAILNRLSLDRAKPIDMLNLKKSLESIVEIFNLIEKDWSKKLKKIINK